MVKFYVRLQELPFQNRFSAKFELYADDFWRCVKIINKIDKTIAVA